MSASANRIYGFARLRRAQQGAYSTIYHHRSLFVERHARRPGPIGAAIDAELIAEYHHVIPTAPFHGEGSLKV